MKDLINHIINDLNAINNQSLNMQKDGVKTLLDIILNGGKLDIILEDEFRNALSPVKLYVKLVADINSKNIELFEIFSRAYSETLTNLNYFINYDKDKRKKYLEKKLYIECWYN